MTGIPNSGKSEWLDALAVNLAEVHGWTFAMCSMEKNVSRRTSPATAAALPPGLSAPFFSQHYPPLPPPSSLLLANSLRC